MTHETKIHPDFFTSADIAALSPMARLFFQYLWAECGDLGVLSWKPDNFRARFFPFDDYSVNDLAKELVSRDLIELGGDYGQDTCCIRNYCRYQRPHRKEG